MLPEVCVGSGNPCENTLAQKADPAPRDVRVCHACAAQHQSGATIITIAPTGAHQLRERDQIITSRSAHQHWLCKHSHASCLPPPASPAWQTPLLQSQITTIQGRARAAGLHPKCWLPGRAAEALRGSPCGGERSHTGAFHIRAAVHATCPQGHMLEQQHNL